MNLTLSVPIFFVKNEKLGEKIWNILWENKSRLSGVSALSHKRLLQFEDKLICRMCTCSRRGPVGSVLAY